MHPKGILPLFCLPFRCTWFKLRLSLFAPTPTDLRCQVRRPNPVLWAVRSMPGKYQNLQSKPRDEDLFLTMNGWLKRSTAWRCWVQITSHLADHFDGGAACVRILKAVAWFRQRQHDLRRGAVATGNTSTSNAIQFMNQTSFPLVRQDLLSDNCPFMVTNNMEYIYVVPILLVLGLNTFFLVWIMWVSVFTLIKNGTCIAAFLIENLCLLESLLPHHNN